MKIKLGIYLKQFEYPKVNLQGAGNLAYADLPQNSRELMLCFFHTVARILYLRRSPQKILLEHHFCVPLARFSKGHANRIKKTWVTAEEAGEDTLTGQGPPPKAATNQPCWGKSFQKIKLLQTFL